LYQSWGNQQENATAAVVHQYSCHKVSGVLISLYCTYHGNTTAAVLFGKAAPSSQLRLVSVLGEVSRNQQQQQFSKHMPLLSQLCLVTVTRRTALSRRSPQTSHGKHRRVNKNMQ
jgi:hypothetical protein